MRIEHHPQLNIWVREDGCVYLPQSGANKAHWTFGSKLHDGYRQVKINGKAYKVHRLAAETFLQYPIPEDMEVDHINRIRDDNSVGVGGNLRIVTRSENHRNTSAHDRVTERGGTHRYENERQFWHEHNAHYRAEHPEKERERHARYRAENKDKVREQKARYNQAMRKTHRYVRFSDGLCRWAPHEEAAELLKLPVKERIFSK